MHPTWQVVTQWVGPGGTETIHISAFDTYEQARQEIHRLAPDIGTVAGGRLLKGVQIIGDYKPLWGAS